MPPKKAAADAGYLIHVPKHFTPDTLITQLNPQYTVLKRLALHENASLMASRAGREWRKSALKPIELYYLWCSRGGKCPGCSVPLDERTMTVEHETPRSYGIAESVYDIRNLTILCHLCNSRRGAKPAILAPGIDPRAGSETSLEYALRGGYVPQMPGGAHVGKALGKWW